MEHSIEDQRRAAKAYKLCLAYEQLCRTKRHMSKQEMHELTASLPLSFWEVLARRNNMRMPSQATVDTAIGILSARAGL
jgi:hypothetical protein